RSQTISDNLGDRSGQPRTPGPSGLGTKQVPGTAGTSGTSRERGVQDGDFTPADRPIFENPCIDVIDKFKRGSINFSDSVTSITRIVVKSNLPDEDHEAEAISKFIKLLEKYQSELQPVHGAGHRESPHPASDDAPGSRNGDPDNQSRDHDRGESKDSDSSGSDSSNFTFHSLSKSLKRANYFLENWSADPKGVLSLLTNTPCCPEIPRSELKKIITGRPINLDALFSGFYSTQTDDKVKQTFGDFELSFGHTKVSKTIKTSAEWTTAWGLAQEAYTFVFPHRATEFARYGTFINQKFSQYLPHRHYQVIEFDKSIRKRIGSSRRFEFTDFRHFDDLVASHFHPGGSHHQPDPNEGTSSKKQKPLAERISSSRKDFCRKYNLGTCTRSAEVCKYGHFCAIC
ncbi:hypothetical protein BJ138DRAFT_1193759, partial [Hygrophoropsis aurantiaca]